MIVISVLAIGSVAILFWMYAGYPISLLFTSKKDKPQQDHFQFPRISLIIPTYNEEVVIKRKIENVLALDYPKNLLEVFLVDSNSKDATLEIVRRFEPTVHIIPLDHKPGKAGAINQTLPHTTGDIVIITDANAFMKQDVLKEIAKKFSDEKVGAVTGAMRQVQKNESSVSAGGGMYWKLEMFMRKKEASLHSVVAMSGEVSAFRRKLLVDEHNAVKPWYVPGGTDDFEMTIWIIRHGYRVAYADTAEVWEYTPDTVSDFLKQKVRIITQTIISIKRNIKAIFSTGLYGAYILVSRKVLPLFSPFLLLLLFICSLILSFTNTFWLIVFILQLLIYFVSFLSTFSTTLQGFLGMPFFFVVLNYSVFLAWMHYWKGVDYTHWETVKSTREL